MACGLEAVLGVIMIGLASWEAREMAFKTCIAVIRRLGLAIAHNFDHKDLYCRCPINLGVVNSQSLQESCKVLLSSLYGEH